MHMLKHLPMALFCLASHAATADTIYKCNEGGRISYNDRPCGKSTVALNVQAAQPAPEVLERLARERAMLQEIEDARAVREEQETRDSMRAQREQRAAAAQRRRCDKLRLQQKWAGEDSERAGREGGEGGDRARMKARRQAEVLAVECPA